MSNRSGPAVKDAFVAHRTITMGLHERLREIPASPLDWSAFDVAILDARNGSGQVLPALEKLLCTAPARTAELRSLWRESVITAAFACRLAPRVGADVGTSVIAGLLHRLGDMLTIRGIAAIEQEAHIRLDAAGRSDLCAVHGEEQLERTVRAWRVPPRAAATAAEWRRLREFPDVARDAATVYLARLLAIELITPEFCAPGVVDLACEEAGLDAAALSAIRGDDTISALLTSLR